MATGSIKSHKTKRLSFSTVGSYIQNPETISAYQTGNVVELVFWGTKFTGPFSNRVLSGLPPSITKTSAYLALGGTDAYNIQGNFYMDTANGGTVTVSLKSSYSAGASVFGGLTYITSE